MADKRIILHHTEQFKIETKEVKGEKKYILSGNAMPLNEMSRNGVFYRPESVKKTYKTLAGNPFLFAHQQSQINHVLGHVTKSGITGTHVTYEVDIDPEEKDFIRKSERGDIKNVSVGVMIDPATVEFDEDTGFAYVDVQEFVELSSAPVPGFKNTSAALGQQQLIALAESLGKEDIVERLKEKMKSKKNSKKENVQEQSDDSEDEEEETIDEKMARVSNRLDEVTSSIEEMVNRVSALESKVDTMLDESADSDDDKDDKEETDEPEKDKDKEDESDDSGDDSDDKEEVTDDDKEDDKEKKHSLTPDKSETFTDNKPAPVHTKEDMKRKEETLQIQSKNPFREAIDLEKQIQKNRRY